MEATKLKPRKTKNNLSQRQKIALRKLRKRKDIVIKKADKGSTVVIQDRQDYIEMGLEHLSDRDTYNELEEDQTKQVANEVTQAIRAMYQEGQIDKPTAEYLLPPPMVRTQEMYFLKKIHKNPPSARPIVSGCSGPTERISTYLDHWLQPLAKSLPSYIRDTKEFIRIHQITQGLHSLYPGCFLTIYQYSNGRRHSRYASSNRKLGRQGPFMSSNQLA